jgi:alpha-mannosidase
MNKPVIHLICNAHLDPVWQWRWDEGAAEALTTFAIAARLLREFPTFLFGHNEAILYRWVHEHDPALFKEIQKLVGEGRWCISGGWDLQPDVNMPGTESLIRHVAEGRQFFLEHFGARPAVAYNFDSFGHSGGLPQILTRAGYAMYVHMRPSQKDLALPSDLYRWRGIDGSEVAAYRIPFEAYNTYPGKTVGRIRDVVDIALRLQRDTPVFWGLGDHGGGATARELEQIHDLMKQETRVEIIHSSTERYYEAIRDVIPTLPVVEGDLQRVFTGCYTSMSRLKRRMQRNLGELVQTEGLRSATWWMRGQDYPADRILDAWRDHLFNDFHDILPGSSVESGELDALDLYGRSSETARRLRFGAASGFSQGSQQILQIPVTVLNMNPGACGVPVELEYMIDHMPKFEGRWHARLFTMEGYEIPVQEEPAESLLLPDEWRRKVCFNATLPHVGASHYRIEMHEGPKITTAAPPMVKFSTSESGLITTLDAGNGRDVLAGEALKGLLVEDLADSWGMEEWKYRNVLGSFTVVPGSYSTLEHGPLRKVTEATFESGRSRIVCRTLAYAGFPFLEFRFRVYWNEDRKRLKLSIPTVFRSSDAFCEVPGGAIVRPADGQEHVQGRWLVLRGSIGGKPTALGIVNSGQYGFDLKDGEVRLSVLRSALYCHEHSFDLGAQRHLKHMDLGVHEFRLVLIAGDTPDVLNAVTGFADWLSAPPYALAHCPIGEETPGQQEVMSLEQGNIRLIACKRSWDAKSLVMRFQETIGEETRTSVSLVQPSVSVRLTFRPYEIKTIRFERDGTWNEVAMIEEQAGVPKPG